MTLQDSFQDSLSWIKEQHAPMCELLRDWAAINSGTTHIEGLTRQHQRLRDRFEALGGTQETITLQPYQKIQPDGEPIKQAVGQALRIRKRPQAPIQVLLCGHMDTVYDQHHPFQQLTQIDENTLNGPGVADMKGGIIVMLYALLAFERSPFTEQLGWEVLLTPDEEIGSYSSASLLAESAKQHQLGLVYEPAITPEGSLAGERKGSGKFTLVVRGRAAHAGRAFADGRNAISAMARLINDIETLNHNDRGFTINIGNIHGGEAVNVVPDLCICNLDVRYQNASDGPFVENALHEFIATLNQQEGIHAECYGQLTRPVKPMAEKTLTLFQLVAKAGEELGLSINWQSSGGCCDGNNLAAAGLPVVDSLGVRGGHIHSAKEYILLDSLVERAQLSHLLLMKLASGEYEL